MCCPEKGYDGMVYKDAGHLSWMIFSSDQVTPVGEPIAYNELL